jgi:hypothetical protein
LLIEDEKGRGVILSLCIFDGCDSYGLWIVNFPLVAVPTVSPLSFL